MSNFSLARLILAICDIFKVYVGMMGVWMWCGEKTTRTKNIHLKEAASGFVNHNFHNLNTTGLGTRDDDDELDRIFDIV